MTYVDFVEDIILGLLRAAPEGNWPLHLTAIRKLIPWCFAYKKTNYAQYLPAYYATMSQLPSNQPEVHEALMKGGFSVQRSDNNSFGRIPVDQTIEVTVNRDTQTCAGTTTFSLQESAVKLDYINAEHRSGFLRKLRKSTGHDNSDGNHGEL